MAADTGGPSIARAFDRSHGARLRSAAVDRLYRSAYGDDYPEDTQPNAFYSGATLRRLAGALRMGPGRTVVDLGCGHGGPGVWVARQTGANLIGIDLAPVGIDLARSRAAELGLDERARFQVGDITATGLPDASCDGAMSLDVLVFVPDKAAALREAARLLRPGGRFAFTTWEQYDLARPAFQAHPLLRSHLHLPGGAAQIVDYRPLLEAAGLAVEAYEEPPDWRRQQRAMAEGILAAGTDVALEMGDHHLANARSMLADLPLVRYVFVVARRLPGGSQ